MLHELQTRLEPIPVPFPVPFVSFISGLARPTLLAAKEAKQEMVARESGLLTAGSFRFCVRMLLAAFIWCGALQIFGAVLGRNEISL
jgi:hypothetical protein